MAQHDAIALAKQIATLDWLSGGRAVVGVGYGWNVEEMEDHGIDAKRRRARVREVMLAMEALWAHEVAAFAGEHVHFEAELAVAEAGAAAAAAGADRRRARARSSSTHIAEFGDGWIPIGGAGLREALPALRAAFEARDRDPASLQLVPMGVLPSREKLDYFAAAGVTEAVLRLPSAPRDEVLPVLDAFARFVA